MRFETLMPVIIPFALATLGFFTSVVVKRVVIAKISTIVGFALGCIHVFLVKGLPYYILTFSLDSLTFLLWFSCLAFGILVVLFSGPYLSSLKGESPEYYYLLSLCTIGAMLWGSTDDLFTFFISMEITSFSSYALCASLRTRAGVESAFKYFISGALFSTLFALGAVFIYAETGTLKFTKVSMSLGPALILASLLFKTGVAPLHFWVPDVYQGAPTPFSGFMASAVKIAGFVGLWRFISSTGVLEQTVIALVIASALSMAFGTFGALVQKDAKRLLGYSSVAHSGFVLLAFLGAKEEILLFYLFVYGISAMGAFGALSSVLSPDFIPMPKIREMGRYSPLTSVGILTFMFSLAGVPPLAGFIGKFLVFLKALSDFWTLIIFACFISVISLFFYLSVLTPIYTEDEVLKPKVVDSPFLKFATLVCAFATLSLGVFPGIFFSVFG